MQLCNFCLFSKVLNILMHIFLLMPNKNLLLPNYYIQLSINDIINLTENIYTTSITEQFSMHHGWEFWSSKSWVGQIFYCTALQTICHRFNIYSSTPVYVALSL